MPKAKVKEGKVRVQFDFTDGTRDMINECKKKLDAASSAEVVRRAIHLLHRCVNDELHIRCDDGEVRPLRIV
jgi:hypothetical protein